MKKDSKFKEVYIPLFGGRAYFNFGYNLNIFKIGITATANHIDIDFGFVWISVTK